MFACVYEDGATIKLPVDRARKLIRRENIHEFRPAGDRVIKNWVLVAHDDPEDFKKDTGLFDEAFSCIYSLTKEKK
jgi:hypothetical protein